MNMRWRNFALGLWAPLVCKEGCPDTAGMPMMSDLMDAIHFNGKFQMGLYVSFWSAMSWI